MIHGVKMKLKKLYWHVFLLLLGSVILLLTIPRNLVRAESLNQIPTVDIPTVTGTPIGAIAFVLDSEQGYANVRAGPSYVNYEVVGVIVEGQEVPAIGRSPGGDWIAISYPGVQGGIAWVWSELVEVRGVLPVLEPPSTPTPQVTPTIDPTLAAQFLVEVPATRLPTYTAPPELILPTLPADEPITVSGRVPMGLVIIGLTVVGIIGILISLLRSR
jgi:hypothetical protein